MSQKVASTHLSVSPNKVSVTETKEEPVVLSPPNARHVEETVYHMPSFSGIATLWDSEVPLENDPVFEEWLLTLPESVQGEITRMMDTVNHLEDDKVPKQITSSVQAVVPVARNTHPLQNAVRLGKKAFCARRGCQNSFLVKQLGDLLCPSCSH